MMRVQVNFERSCNNVHFLQSAVIYMILKFVVDFVDGQAVFLDAKETSVLVSFCLKLLQIYSSHNIGKVWTGILIITLFFFSTLFLHNYGTE